MTSGDGSHGISMALIENEVRLAPRLRLCAVQGSWQPAQALSDWLFLVFHLVGISSILGTINFISTIFNMRASGIG